MWLVRQVKTNMELFHLMEMALIIWKFRLNAVMRAQELCSVVKETDEKDKNDNWPKKNVKACMVINYTECGGFPPRIYKRDWRCLWDVK